MQANPAVALAKALKKRLKDPKLSLKVTRAEEKRPLTKMESKPSQITRDTPLDHSVTDMHLLGAKAVGLARELVEELVDQNENGLMMEPKTFASHVRALKELYEMGREALNIPKLAPIRFQAVKPEDWMKKLQGFKAHTHSIAKSLPRKPNSRALTWVEEASPEPEPDQPAQIPPTDPGRG